MLAKENRIQKDSDYKKVFRFSAPIYEGGIILRVSKQNYGVARFGFIISNKVEKRATKRNEIKRKFRAAAQELLPQIASPASIIVLIKKNYPRPIAFAIVKKDLESGLAKAGLLK